LKKKVITGTLLVMVSIFLLISVNHAQLPRGYEASDERFSFESMVTIEVFRRSEDGVELVYHHESSNVKTNVGLHLIERLLGGKGTWNWTEAEGGTNLYYLVDEPNDIALSSDATGVNATHSTWQPVDGSYPSDIEITTGGLERDEGTVTMDSAYTPGTGSTMGSITFTISTTYTVKSGFNFSSVQKAGLFAGNYNTNDGSGSGGGKRISPLFAENTFTPLDLIAGDSIAITWRITV
jgi:hypothetical protein